MAVVTLVPVGSLALRARTLATDAADAREEASLLREAGALATFVGSWVDAQSRTLAGWHRVWDLESRDAQYRIGLARAVYRAIDPVVTVALVDGEGRPVVRPQFLDAEDVPSGRVPGSAERAQAALAHLPPPSIDGVAVGRPYAAPDTGEPTVAMLAGRPGDPVLLAAEVSLHLVERTLQAGPQTAVVLLDDVQQAVAGDAGTLAAVGGLGDVVTLGANVTFQTEARLGEQEVTYRGATARVPFLPWTVAVLRAEAAEGGVGTAIRDEALRVMGIVAFVLVAIGIVLDRTLTRSVQRLIQHAHRIRDGDYAARSRIVRRDELGELADAFDEMAGRLEVGRASLEAAYDELAAFNQDLQDRVAARTRDLEAAQAQLVRAAQVEVVAEVGAGLAHELNNPLAVILGQIELARSRGGADDAAMARVERAARRCREVVETMHSVVADGVGEATPAPRPVVDWTRIVREAATGAQHAQTGRDVLWVDDLGDGVRSARVEPVVLRRAVSSFLDLLGSTAGAGSTLTLTSHGDTVQIAVDRAVRSGRSADDWKAGSVRIWGARRLAERAGVRVVAEDEDGRRWRLEPVEPVEPVADDEAGA